jgi:hypothetical protein
LRQVTESRPSKSHSMRVPDWSCSIGTSSSKWSGSYKTSEGRIKVG